MTLPYPAAHPYILRDGCLHQNSSGNEYHISGHINQGATEITLLYSDKVASSVQDVAFTSSAPITLTVNDNFHIAGTYEIEV